jgi:hypothetical protein
MVMLVVMNPEQYDPFEPGPFTVGVRHTTPGAGA